jgi:hypothetical protein
MSNFKVHASGQGGRLRSSGMYLLYVLDLLKCSGDPIGTGAAEAKLVDEHGVNVTRGEIGNLMVNIPFSPR